MVATTGAFGCFSLRGLAEREKTSQAEQGQTMKKQGKNQHWQVVWLLAYVVLSLSSNSHPVFGCMHAYD